MKTVGTRRADGNPFDDQGCLARTARALRPAGLAPRGVYRFASFEEAGTWLLQTMRRSPAPRSRKTSPASAGRLNDAGARYVLIGGFAMIAHGGGGFTKDIDLLIDDAPENVARVRQGLAVLADHAAAELGDLDIDYGPIQMDSKSPKESRKLTVSP